MSGESSTIGEAVAEFFRLVNWPVEGPDASGSFTGTARGQNGRFACLVAVDEDLRLLTFYAYCPERVPVGRRAAAAEYLTRANFRMRLGNFEMDFADGEVCFKTQTLGAGTVLKPEVISVVVNSGLSAMDRYYPALTETIRGLEPEAAIRLVEGT